MFQRFTAILPDAQPGWQRWSCPSASASAASLLEKTDSPSPPTAKPSGRVLAALPARVCRTFAVRIPSQDPKTVRKLALAQLEKRGLAAAEPERTPFECRALPLPEGGAVLTVDVASAEAVAAFAPLKPAALLPAARCYSFPGSSLVLTSEQGRLILLAGRDGTVIHSQPLSAPRGQLAQTAAEIRAAMLTLQQLGLIADITALEIRGGLTPTEATAIGTALHLPAVLRPVLTPDPALIAKSASARLLPGQGRAAQRGRQLLLLKCAAAAAVVLGGCGWWFSQTRSLAALEKRAAELENRVNAGAGDHLAEKAISDRVRATQERWQGLRMVLDPRRYPMVHLNSLTKCLGDGGIVLGRFESKGPDLAVTGTADSAAQAYTFYTSVNTDADLRVYEWSMVEPVIAANGTASFNLKGKMR